MQFLKILFWCLLAFLAAIFTIGNWTTVQIKLWGGLVAEVNLPLLLLVMFLLGLLPMLLYHQVVRWRLRQRLSAAQGAVETLRGTSAPTIVTVRPALQPDHVPVTPMTEHTSPLPSGVAP
jgi:putative membrane protein